MTCAPRLLCAEQNVRNLKKCTFRNSGTPVRRTRRRKSQKLHSLEIPTDIVAAAQLRRHQSTNVQQMMVAVLRARRLEAGINGPGDAEMADRGSDIGEERGPHNEDGCTPDTEHLCMESR